MSDEGPDNLVLRYLRNMDGKLDRIGEDVRELKLRMSAVEDGLVGMRRDVASLYESQVRAQHTLDRQGDRLGRIERRLEIQPAG
jgi:hypothetical protein